VSASRSCGGGPAACAGRCGADEAEAEAGDRCPQPPRAAVLLERPEERQDRHGDDSPDDRADGHGADAVDVHRLDLGDPVGRVADLELGQLGTAELVAARGTLEPRDLAVAHLALDGLRPVSLPDDPVVAVAHPARLPAALVAPPHCCHAEGQ
jgi:hypothetical protein